MSKFNYRKQTMNQYNFPQKQNTHYWSLVFCYAEADPRKISWKNKLSIFMLEYRIVGFKYSVPSLTSLLTALNSTDPHINYLLIVSDFSFQPF